MAESEFVCKHCGQKFGSQTALGQHSQAKHGELMQPKKEFIDERKKKQYIKYGLIALVVLVVLVGGYALISAASKSKGIGPVGSTHTHMNVSVIINGLPIDFSQSKYQLRAQYVHFEDGDGRTMHKHATGVTFKHLLDSLNIKADNTCLTVEGTGYCIGNGKTLRYFLNGQVVEPSTLLDRDSVDGDTYKIEYI